MREDDFVRVRNLTRLRIANEVLRAIITDNQGGIRWGVGDGELAPALSAIDDLTQRLREMIGKTESET